MTGRRILATVMVLGLGARPVQAEPTAGETRFFARCPQRPGIRLHDERLAWDLHTVFYTTMGLAEVEVVRIVDGLIDAPIPGAVRPTRRVIEALRSGYNRLPPWWVRVRVGEFVGALQLPELSLGDAASTYSATTGGLAGPGSGMMIRIDRLMDWTQRLVGDVNRTAGRPLRRPGLVTWSGPERAVDAVQELLLRLFHEASVLIGRTGDTALTATEGLLEGVLNLGHQRPHRDETVFLRLPLDVYRAHELWVLEHREQLVVAPPEIFLRATHAELAHGRRRLRLHEWAGPGEPGREPAVLVVMAPGRVIARSPKTLRAYIVPAAWILNEPASIDSRQDGV